MGLSAFMVLLSIQASAVAPDRPEGRALAERAAPSYGPAPPTKVRPKTSTVDTCRNTLPTEPGEIVVCAQKPDGYRIDPDLLAAEKMIKEKKKPKPSERFADKSCETVGPMGCRGQVGVDLLAAARTLGTMADRLSKGQEIGSLFVTDPQPDEYQLYMALKREREEKEAMEAAKAASQPR